MSWRGRSDNTALTDGQFLPSTWAKLGHDRVGGKGSYVRTAVDARLRRRKDRTTYAVTDHLERQGPTTTGAATLTRARAQGRAVQAAHTAAAAAQAVLSRLRRW
ncbi:hypothetical protein [Streptomyces canus]|uniref:hypothetical protein n=1 Tax=Streptomyces canus TaxID=58343 RepID=UPI002DDB7806|nr:hypothetical protein [Streptomyces canus]WSD83335.1 hypothetical protein OG925_03055 [Streptomyces canus]